MKKSLIKVSVIIPVYNSEKYLETCIESVLAQSLREIEIIIVDDGSTDNSWQIISRYADQDSRIVALRRRNSGVSATRNAGLRKAHGEYVGFVDSDDYVDVTYFEHLYAGSIGDDRADIISSYVKTENESRQRFYNETNKQNVLANRLDLKGVVWLNIYNLEMIKRNRIRFLPKLRTAEDNLFNLKASYYANKIVSVGEKSGVYHHVTRDDSLTIQQQDSGNFLQLCLAVLETVKQLNSLRKYDQDIYVARVSDTLGYFYQRFVGIQDLDENMKKEISSIFIAIWKKMKYRDQFLQASKDKKIDLKKIIYGETDMQLYNKYAQFSGGYKAILLRRQSKPRGKMHIMGLAKKSLKAVLPHAVVRLYEKRHELRPESAPLNNKKIAVFSVYDIKYTQLLHEAIRFAGYEPTSKVADAKYIWLHWYENRIADYAGFVDKLTTIKTWKQQGRKVIFHIHNKKPHESKVPNISHALMTALADSADQVSIMSTQTKDMLKDMWYYGDDFSHVSRVPHPNYIGAYGEMLNPTTLKSDTLKILFFGLVRPYKGIEHLLEATKGLKNLEVTIAGNPSNTEYANQIKKLCINRNNINLRLEYISDEDIPSVFAEHHIVALPYNIESSLNSGAAILALSYGRTIVGTNNGTLNDIPKKDLYFGYDYADEDDHPKQLRKAIKAIQTKYGSNYNELLKVGNKAFQHIQKENGTEAVAGSIAAMISRIG